MIINGTVGIDFLFDTLGEDDIFGFNGDDKIVASGGFDHIWDGGGTDTVILKSGGMIHVDVLHSSGSDIFVYAPTAPETGRAATISYAAATSVLAIDLAAGTVVDLQGSNEIGTDILVGFTNAIGGEHSDYMTASAVGSILEGRGGQDGIIGGIGNDRLFGGAGLDYVLGGAGSDWLHGNDGNDFLCGDTGADWIFGGSGDDQLYSGAENDYSIEITGNRLDGGDGNDVIVSAGTGDNVFDGLGNDDVLILERSTLHAYTGGWGDYLIGRDDDDYRNSYFVSEDVDFRTLPAISYASATEGIVVLLSIGFGEAYGPQIGHDTFSGFGSAIGGSGNDIMQAGGHGALLQGRDGDDQLYGHEGDDLLVGGNGQDLLEAHVGRDRLFGGDGSDELRGWEESAILDGGAGDDYIIGSEHYCRVRDGSGQDFVLMGVNGGIIIADTSDLDGNDKFVSEREFDFVQNQNIYGKQFTVSYSSDTKGIQAGFNGSKNSRYGECYSVATGHDTFENANRIVGGSGDDELDNHLDYESSNSLYGLTFLTLVGGDGNDTFRTSYGSTIALGGAGNDWFAGGDGRDRFHGGSGENTMSGGGGRDVFYAFSDGAGLIETTTILDFENGVDKIGIKSSSPFGDFASLQAIAQDGLDANSLILSADGYGSVTILGLSLLSLDRGDVVFW